MKKPRAFRRGAFFVSAAVLIEDYGRVNCIVFTSYSQYMTCCSVADPTSLVGYHIIDGTPPARRIRQRTARDSSAAPQEPEIDEPGPAEQFAILREHPILGPAVTGAGENQTITIFAPNKSLEIRAKGLVSGLVRHAVKTTGACAARLLHRYLTEGKDRKLQARAFVVIHGLKLAARIDLDDGAFLAPLDDRFVAEQGFSREDAERLRTWGMAKYFRDGSGGSSVLVRDLTWGPGIAPASAREEEDHPELTYRFHCDPRIVTDLLSVAAHRPSVASTRHIRVAPWMHDVNPNFAYGSWGGGGFVTDGWWRESDLSADRAAVVNRSVAGWAGFQYDSDEQRDTLSLADARTAATGFRVVRPLD